MKADLQAINVFDFFFLSLGITHAAVWAACCSFIAHNTDAELRPSAQSFLQGLHHGFGRFSGAVFGGMMIKSYGTILVFRIYGAVCAVIFVLFCAVNFANMKEGSSEDLPEGVDPQFAEQSAHLAPHGVPGGAMPRGLSSAKLEEQDTSAAAPEQYGENLNVAGGKY